MISGNHPKRRPNELLPLRRGRQLLPDCPVVEQAEHLVVRVAENLPEAKRAAF